MERNEVFEKVRKVVSDHLKVDAAELKEEAEFAKDLGADSIKSIELVALFENEFDVEMDEDEALKIQTVGNAVDFIMQYLQ